MIPELTEELWQVAAVWPHAGIPAQLGPTHVVVRRMDEATVFSELLKIPCRTRPRLKSGVPKYAVSPELPRRSGGISSNPETVEKIFSIKSESERRYINEDNLEELDKKCKKTSLHELTDT